MTENRSESGYMQNVAALLIGGIFAQVFLLQGPLPYAAACLDNVIDAEPDSITKYVLMQIKFIYCLGVSLGLAILACDVGDEVSALIHHKMQNRFFLTKEATIPSKSHVHGISMNPAHARII